MNPTKNIKLMMIGYLPPPIGGVTVLFKQLVDDIYSMDNIDIIVVDLATENKQLINKLSILYKSLSKIVTNLKDIDIITFHAVTGSTIILGPIIYVLAKIFRKKIIIREFGGVFHKKYKKFSFFTKFILKNTIFKSDIFLFETKEQVHFFNTLCKRTEWYPNSRKLGLNNQEIHPSAEKFVFISQMKKSKGVQEIFYASKDLPKQISIDLYGPLNYDISKKDIDELNSKYPAKYFKSLNPSEVSQILTNYDVVLLPTYHYGEGYPGIILEAYIYGLPVITTKWNAIPEIVDNTSGILIEPKNSNQLKNAILKLYHDKEYYIRLQKGAQKKAIEFSSQVWSEKFIDYCKELL